MPQLPTSSPMDYSPSASHRELENNYTEMPHSPTDFSPSASHRELENNYTEMPQSPTSIPTTLVTYIPTECFRRYVVGGQILLTKIPTECANSKGCELNAPLTVSDYRRNHRRTTKILEGN